MIIQKDEIQIARAVISKHNDGSLSFAGNLNEGDILEVLAIGVGESIKYFWKYETFILTSTVGIMTTNNAATSRLVINAMGDLQRAKKAFHENPSDYNRQLYDAKARAVRTLVKLNNKTKR